MCNSRKKNPYPTDGRSLEIPRGRGIFKVKFLEAKLEFPRRRGVQKTKPSVGGTRMNIFCSFCFQGQYERNTNCAFENKVGLKRA